MVFGSLWEIHLSKNASQTIKDVPTISADCVASLIVVRVAMVRSSSDDNAICRVLRFVDDVTFSHKWGNGAKSNTTLCFVQFVSWRWQSLIIYDCMVPYGDDQELTLVFGFLCEMNECMLDQ